MRYIFLIVFILLNSSLFSSKYHLNEQIVNKMISTAKESNTIALFHIELSNDFNSCLSYSGGNKSPIVSFLTCWFLGFLGVHRLYLGTSTETFIVYLLTCGGCGIVWMIDWIALFVDGVIKNNLDPYIDNPMFFMW